MAQPAKPLIVLHAGTHDPTPKRQILRNRGRMWKRRCRIAFETCHVTSSSKHRPFQLQRAGLLYCSETFPPTVTNSLSISMSP